MKITNVKSVRGKCFTVQVFFKFGFLTLKTECEEEHYKENCKSPKGFDTVMCTDCGRPKLARYVHNCTSFGVCDNCSYKFESNDDKADHVCYLQPENTFWDPISDNGKFSSHWFYDFETTGILCEEYTGPVQKRHEVMAWCVRLMIPCSATKAHVENSDFITKIIFKLEAKAEEGGLLSTVECQTIGEHSIRFYGKKLESFLALCSEILVQNKKDDTWSPTLWAHNGSKFDAKFILDHYLNVENFDLAGPTYEEEFKNPTPVKENGEIKWKMVTNQYKGRRNVVTICVVGSKILQMNVKGMTFQCSHAHHAAPLRDLPSRFGLEVEVKKGEFPYPLLKPENWGKVFPTFPDIEYFDVDSMSTGRRDQVLNWYAQQPKNVPWNFDNELWGYLFSDVDVGCLVMEAYHKKSEELHMDLWNKYPDRSDKHCSPLLKSTSPGWALKMYRTWFMPEDQLAILKPKAAKFIRESLRGGRTDKRANWVELEPNSNDKITYVDFKSLYPSVQKCNVHDTHFPVGKGEWMTMFKGDTTNEKLISDMGDKTGFLRIDTDVPKKYVTHPTLHRVGAYSTDEKSKKLLFELDPKKGEVYAWPEIQEAIRCGEIEVTHVHEAFLFDKGTDVFDQYVDFFFAVKDQAEIDKNEGLRSLAKLLLNSLWGKLGQRSHAAKEWVVLTERRDYLMHKFETGEWDMLSCVLKDDFRAYFSYRIPEDKNNLKTTAPHIAAFVSMWGRVVLHRKLLSVHGARALYCDTDSAIVYLRGGKDEMFFTGNRLGDLTDEVKKIAPRNYTDAYISQAVLVAPKTYALEIKSPAVAEPYHKVVCKGFEPSYANSKQIHFDSFKELVFTKYNLNTFMNNKRPGEHEDLPVRHYIRGDNRLTFKSSLAENRIAPVESRIQKSLSGEYGKGEKHPHDPRFIVPFSKAKVVAPKETFLNDRNKHFE